MVQHTEALAHLVAGERLCCASGYLLKPGEPNIQENGTMTEPSRVRVAVNGYGVIGWTSPRSLTTSSTSARPSRRSRPSTRCTARSRAAPRSGQ